MWNHRVVEHEGPAGEIYYLIHEVYYDDETQEVAAWSEDGMAPFGETIDEIWQDLLHFTDAFHKPVLKAKELPGGIETS